MSTVLKHTRTLLTLCLSLALPMATFQAMAEGNRPIVITSLKPVELLVRAVAGDQAEVHSLVPSGASPHTYQLRPSERRLLEDSDAIFWIGPDMETFLTRLLGGQDFRNRTLALAPATGEAHEDSESHNDHDDHGGRDEAHDAGLGDHHDHGEGPDPHLWLDPAMALKMAQAIAERLKQLEGIDDKRIETNLASFTRDLEATEADIARKLEPAQAIDLFTYHNAFGQFAAHYGLEIVGVLTMSPERSPGARHLAEVQDRLRKASRPCLLTEPQFNRQWWLSLMEGVEMPLSTWDPLAGEIKATSEGYISFQYALADAVLRCLPENAQ